MNSIQQQISVGFRHPIHFTRGVFDAANPLVRETLGENPGKNGEKILFVIDDGVLAHHRRLVEAIDAYCRATGLDRGVSQPHVVLPGGERVKNEPIHLQAMYRAVNDRGICRHSTIVVIGGGAVLDLAGYAAATAHRGIRVIRIPTTVLAQNDSGVGVKTGINAFGKKNFIGAFAPPAAVINDWDFLPTLDQRDWLAGISEAVKVGLIKDAAFFQWIQQNAAALVNRDLPAMQKLIHRCAEPDSNGSPLVAMCRQCRWVGSWATRAWEPSRKWGPP